MPSVTTQPPLNRADVPLAETWRLEDIFADAQAWEDEFARLPDLLKAVVAFRGRLGKSAVTLAAALRAHDELERRLMELYVYARMSRDLDNSQAEAVSRAGKIADFAFSVGAQTAFFQTELATLPEGVLEQFLTGSTELSDWRHALENLIRNRPHVLSELEEALLQRFGPIVEGLGDAFTMFENVDLKFGSISDGQGGQIELTQGVFGQLRDHPDRQVRADAFARIHESFGAYGRTLAALYAARVKADILFAEAHRHPSSLSAALFADNLPDSLYQALIETVREGRPIMERYLSLRQRLLSYEQLHIYDIYVPIVDLPRRRFSYEEAGAIVRRGLAPLGEAYGQMLEQHLADRWIDVRETPGKTAGAYSWGTYGTHPYILLNYQGQISDVFTLAHELGHSLHTWLSNQRPYAQANYPIFLAEIASTVNEILLLRSLVRECADDAEGQLEKAYLLNHFLEEFRGTMFRQTMFAEFEWEAHKIVEAGGSLTAERLCDLYSDLLRDYFGSQVVLDPYMSWEWARIPHFYRAYYVFQYATGFAAAAAIVAAIDREGQPAVDRYLEFLGSGASDYPLALLRQAGVDLSGPEPIRAALAEMDRTLSQLERLTEEGTVWKRN